MCEVPYGAIDLIAKSVPNKQFFVCIADDAVKLLVKRDRLYETAWLPRGEAAVDMRGANLDELWDSLSSQVVFGDSSPADFTGRVERKNRIETLRKELAAIDKKRRNEKQVNRGTPSSIAGGRLQPSFSAWRESSDGEAIARNREYPGRECREA